MARLIEFTDKAVVRPLALKREIHRWQALVTSVIQRRGDNGYTQYVPLANPAGHRFNATGTWSNNAFDPFTDIYTARDLLISKGYKPGRIIAGTSVVNIMAANALVKARLGLVTTDGSGNLVVQRPGRASLADKLKFEL